MSARAPKSRRRRDEISTDDPRRPDVRAVLTRHLDFTSAQSPPEDSHALELEALTDPAVTFVSFRRQGQLLGIGALKRVDARHAEIKSMHTLDGARRAGVGRAILEYLLTLAAEAGFERVSLETGSAEAFASARALYASAGFQPCGPFADYQASRHSVYLTRSVGLT